MKPLELSHPLSPNITLCELSVAMVTRVHVLVMIKSAPKPNTVRQSRNPVMLHVKSAIGRIVLAIFMLYLSGKMRGRTPAQCHSMNFINSEQLGFEKLNSPDIRQTPVNPARLNKQSIALKFIML